MVVQRLVGESLDAGSEAVPVDVRPVDAAVRRLWVVLDCELDRACNLVVGQYGRESQSGIDASGNPGRPCSRPAPARSSEPVHTEVTMSAVRSALRR